MRKKLLTLMLAAVMAIGGMSLTASAATATTAQTVTASIEKLYTLTNDGTTSPADTFLFTVTNYSVSNAADGVTVSNMPTPSITAITVAEGDATTAGKSYDLQINLPSYTSVGVYTYEIEETNNNLAGVTYSTTKYYLVVTVTYNDSTDALEVSSYYLHAGSVSGLKTTNIKNYYSAGSLAVTKEVTGNLGDTEKEFTVTVTFTKATGTTVASTISYVVGTETKTIAPSAWGGNESVSVEITVKDGTTITFTNIPYNVSYTIAENTYSDYDTTYVSTDSTDTGTGTMSEPSETVTITNNKEGTVDTGVILDSLPYILILAVVLIGVVYLVLRRRTSDRY
ncbi:MAG: hypothetical protein LUI13_04765 [Lachnospiraceae bacterium]|nr:hypothetical protein [Lachnospiraceae bacterium]